MLHTERYQVQRSVLTYQQREQIYIGFGAGGGGRPPPPPTFWPWGGKGAHHFELQALVCIVFSGKVINSYTAMHYQGYQSNNKQPAGPLILHISESYFNILTTPWEGDMPPTPSPPCALCAPSCSLHSHYAPPPPPHFQSCSKAYDLYLMFKVLQSVTRGFQCQV